MIRVGISGWRYAGWRGDFYPRGLPQRAELGYVAERLTSVEINGSFYALQRPESYAAWRDSTRADFGFAVKGGRFITHLKKLLGVETALANFYASGVLGLGAKLGPLLWQLPPQLAFEPSLVEAFLAGLPRTAGELAVLAAGHDAKLPPDRALTTAPDPGHPVRHAVEVRHASFRDPRYLRLLRRYGVSSVVADTAGRFPYLEEITADLVYIRLHGDTELYASGYSPAALDRWAAKITAWDEAGLDVWAYFDNDVKVRAPYDAMALSERLGLTPAGR